MENSKNDLKTQILEELFSEPVSTENSVSSLQNAVNGNENLQDGIESRILGKFKTVDDLKNAYQELEKRQGLSSAELGHLRKELASVNSLKQSLEQIQSLNDSMQSFINRDKEKYNTLEYFQDPTFREIYKEAVYALGDNLDTDKFVNLLESYVAARIFSNNKKLAEDRENQTVIDSMSYSSNPKSILESPRKRIDEMTDKEIGEMLEKYI